MGGHAGVSRTHDILDPRHVPELRTFARTRVLLAFDYDGTLSPIAPTPEQARLPASTRRLPHRVAKHYPLVVISGRALADISERVADIGVRHIFGNHGLEWSGGTIATSCPGPPMGRSARASNSAGTPASPSRTRRTRCPCTTDPPPTTSARCDSSCRSVRELPDVRVICGAAAVNLLPDHGANKGVALRRALETERLRDGDLCRRR